MYKICYIFLYILYIYRKCFRFARHHDGRSQGAHFPGAQVCISEEGVDLWIQLNDTVEQFANKNISAQHCVFCVIKKTSFFGRQKDVFLRSPKGVFFRSPKTSFLQSPKKRFFRWSKRRLLALHIRPK